MLREIEPFIRKDLATKMVFLSGPRQSGKTTISRQLGLPFTYLNYDVPADRKILLAQEWDRTKELLIFDELHKFRKWKNWIKGVFDEHERKSSILVTGSARMDVYRKGGDSLAGRFFPYRLHPFTVSELKDQLEPDAALERILKFGGFPEPFLKNDANFARRWRRGHLDVILRQDLLDLESVRDIKLIEVLLELLLVRVGSTTSFSSLANDLQVSVHTVKHWLQILENLYVIFPVRPYSKNMTRSLLKETKYYFYDTGAVAEVENNPGAIFENAVACALARELHFCEDTTGKKTGLFYLRDKEKHEVDFLTVVQTHPTHLIEVKYADDQFSRNLSYFKRFFPEAEAYQVVFDLDREKSTPELKMVKGSSFLVNLNFQ